MKTERLFSVLLILTAVICAIAQQPQDSAPNKTKTPSAENRGTRNYLLGPGDVLEIKGFGQPDLSTNAQIDADGNVSSLAFLEPIPAKCRTERQVQADVALAYSKLIKSPQISVRLVERNSRQPASVFGAVRQATRVPTERRIRLNEVMAASGGLTERASGTVQILHTEPVMCPEKGDEIDSLPIDPMRIPLQIVKVADLKKGLAKANPFIRPGDLVYVNEAEPIYVNGSVVSPGEILMRDQLTLTRALGMVGGTLKDAKLSEIRIYRQKPLSVDWDILKVDFQAVKKNQTPDVFLQPFDVIEVSELGALSPQRWPELVISALTGGLKSALSTSTFVPGRLP